MKNAAFTALYNQFKTILQNGDEQAARDFLVNHFQEFPQELQGAIATAFFKEAVDTMSNETEHVTAFAERLHTELKDTQKLKRAMEDRLRVMELEQK